MAPMFALQDNAEDMLIGTGRFKRSRHFFGKSNRDRVELI
jgi:hypothetical protein